MTKPASFTKIAPGHYRNANGTARNVQDGSGAPHVRHGRALWLVTPANGKPSYFVPTLARAREALA